VRSLSILKSLLTLFIVLVLSSPINILAQEIATVIRVIDGDTLKINYEGQVESIRLIGIDTPESAVNPKAKKDSKRTDKDDLPPLIVSVSKLVWLYTQH